MKYDVFISYSRKDYVVDDKSGAESIPGNVIKKLLEELHKAEITPWIDLKGIYSGDSFAREISKAIAAAPIFLFISSVNSNRPECWSADEVALARHKKKFIIPFLIDDTPYNDDFALFIAKLDYIDYCAEGEHAFVKLVDSINRKLDELDPNRRNIRELKEEQNIIRREIKQNMAEWKIVVDKLARLGEKVDEEEFFDKEQVKKLQEIISKMEKEIKGLHNKLDALKVELEVREKTNCQLKDRGEELQSLSEHKQSLILQVEQQLAVRSADVKMLQLQINELQKEKEKYKADAKKYHAIKAEEERHERERKKRKEEESRRWDSIHGKKTTVTLGDLDVLSALKNAMEMQAED